ncbi:Rv3654c family TadE-like protein [Luteipulveratus halotolerans]|uniref:Uncharacterized protein n=1 Tax=Luteipulveratus halotolerans TaxID=1631356 RepID=A0A0L6CE90_9MICO|nr:Rv3654c family TadE-like protein [Luteipulveratus halotolerans]KNX36122.1 hypothetical protein VV01_01500 [Luteipulveratus halotolerans]
MSDRVSRRSDRGSGSLLMIGVCGVLLVLLTGAMVLVSAVHASARARAAADLAALAAADLVLNPTPGEAPCTRASRLAAANGGELVACSTGQDDVVVTVRVESSASVIGAATARSRAGLSPESASSPPTRPMP